jgi:hypothetical protein
MCQFFIRASSITTSGVQYKFQKINYVGIGGTVRNPNNVTSNVAPNYNPHANYGIRTYNGTIIVIGNQGGNSISSIGLEALSDGTSNTVGISEQSNLVKDSSGNQQEWGASGHRGGGWNGGNSGSGSPAAPGSSGWVSNTTHIYWTINSICPGGTSDARCNQPFSSSTIITSSHTGGAQFAVMDGSVRFIADTVNFNDILLRLAARNDGLPVSMP